MLIKTDTNQIPIQQRDQAEFARHQNLAEEAADDARAFAPLAPDAPGGMDVTDKEQRMGRPLSAWAIQQKLEKIVPFLYFEKSNKDPSKIGIYIRSNVRSPELYKGDLIFVCGMESGISPEFSIIEVEATPVPDANSESGERLQFGMAREIRGWRTVLARLLKWRIISAYDVEKHFQVSIGRDSSRWQQALLGSMEVFSQETENIHVGRDRDSNTEKEGPTGQDSEPGSDNGGSGGGSEGLRPGTEEADGGGTEEAGQGSATGRTAAQADDPTGNSRDAEEGRAAEELLPLKAGWIDLVSGPDSF